LPSLSRVDAGTVELVRAAGVTVKSSDGLVQFAKATWGPEGRKKHYVAVHHLVELRKEATGYITKQLAAGAAVTEREVQVRIEKGMATRGLVGPAPVVAFGKNTADPDYVPAAGRTATLGAGEVVLISLAGKVDGGMFAAHTWVAVADSVVSAKIQVAFETAALARDEALALVSDRVKRRRAVKGWEVDKAARDFLTKAGVIERALHRTGHSLDGDLYGSGTDLDDLEVKDQRNLVVGTGFTVGPGLYYAGELGVRAEVSAYLGKDGLEVTTPVQEWVETLMPLAARK
jgi:Xaa-Pro aminopeptidase